ncbi:MAG: hypothetical protein KGL46_07285 [Hyphomicrobiales bacterium]|nr:hypothetical protein [Hyphomicrobiales bacterium]
MTSIVAEKTKFSDRMFKILENVEYRCARTFEEKRDIYRLRYQAYLREGALDPNVEESFSDQYDLSPNVWIIGVHINRQLAASIRLHIAREPFDEIPARESFADIVEPRLASGGSLLDPTRFVANLAHSLAYPELPFIALRICMLAGVYFKPRYMLATVRAEHQAFYKRAFGYEPLSDARPYLKLKKPLSCMELRCDDKEDFFSNRYPFFVSTSFERARIFDISSNNVSYREVNEMTNLGQTDRT